MLCVARVQYYQQRSLVHYMKSSKLSNAVVNQHIDVSILWQLSRNHLAIIKSQVCWCKQHFSKYSAILTLHLYYWSMKTIIMSIKMQSVKQDIEFVYISMLFGKYFNFQIFHLIILHIWMSQLLPKVTYLIHYLLKLWKAFFFLLWMVIQIFEYNFGSFFRVRSWVVSCLFSK